MTVNSVVTGSMLKGLREAGCRITTICKCKGYLLYGTEITYTLQPRFCKVDYRSVNVQCPNSAQDNTILMMVLEAVM